MASCQAAILVLLGLLIVSSHAQTANAPAPGIDAPTETELAKLTDSSASDFVLSPTMNALANSTASMNSQRQLAQWPALATMGIAQTYFVLGACALRPPHYHLRATGLLYLISGSIQVGFTTEEGKLYANNITAGASAIFPQGLVHYQQNMGCEPATYTISYNAPEPGTQTAVPGLFGLPSEVVAPALGLSGSQEASLAAGVPSSTFIPNSDPTCVAECAMAPATSSPATTAG